jgi:hypothetical protein
MTAACCDESLLVAEIAERRALWIAEQDDRTASAAVAAIGTAARHVLLTAE